MRLRKQFALIVPKRVPFEGNFVAASLANRQKACPKQENDMKFLLVYGRVLATALALWITIPALAAFAQEPDNIEDMGWRSVISDQIEAFRRGDAATAF